MDLDPGFITYVLVDLDAGVVADSHSATGPGASPDDVLSGMERSIALIEEAEVDASRLLGIGVAAPGPIDRDAGVLSNPPLLGGWSTVPLRDALADRLGLPVALDKDVYAAAVAESWSSGIADAGIFYTGTGTGIGMGLILGGQIVRGLSANAGDIGHLRVRDGGPVCVCGRCGLLGANASPSHLVRSAVDAGVLDPAGPHGAVASVDASFTGLVDLALGRNDVAREILFDCGRSIAYGLAQIANLLDVPTIVCAGPFWDRLATVALNEIRRIVATDPVLVAPHPLRVDSAALGPDVGAIGAACLVLDAVFAPRPSARLTDPA